jgi:carbonic anhydrase
MTIRRTILFLTVIPLFALLSYAQQKPGSHWSYDGAGGPTHWGDLSSDFSACKTGDQQSPINITRPVVSELPAIKFDYKPAILKVIDNGHTIQVNYPPGSHIQVGNQTYQLLQFHFHHPSEEQIDGKSHDFVVHLVHQDAEQHKAVVAVLADQGQVNPVIEAVLSHLPKAKEQEITTNVTIDAADLLPPTHSYYTFPGSLTTPPCSEGVTWLVLQKPVTLSASELSRFTGLYPHNARPVQPLNGRKVLASH